MAFLSQSINILWCVLMNNKNIFLFTNVNIVISIIAFLNQIYVLIADDLDFQKVIFILLFSALTIVGPFVKTQNQTL